MKQSRILIVLLAVLLLGALPVRAASAYVVDDAGLLTQDELLSLEEEAKALSDAWGLDVVIVTTWSLDGRSAQSWANDYYDSHGYGQGPTYSGLLLLLAMEDRDWAVSTCGNAISILPDAAIDRLMEQVLPDLSDGAYYAGFRAFLQNLPDYFQPYQEDPITSYPEPGADSQNRVHMLPGQIHLGWLIGLSLAVAGISVGIMAAAMKTAVPQNTAGYYLDPGSFHLYQSRDWFLYSRTSRARRSESSASGSGHRSGGSSHRSSGGRSHGGRSGKF